MKLRATPETNRAGNPRYLSDWGYNPNMSRLRRLVTTEKIFFVTCNALPELASLTDAERSLFLTCLGKARQRLSFRLFAYVIMPNHWHALIRPAPRRSISSVMHSIKRNSALVFNRRRQRAGPFWQGRYYESFLRKVRDFHEALDYIHTNPVRDGFVRTPEVWPWSSYRQYAGRERSQLSVDLLVLPSDPDFRLWG